MSSSVLKVGVKVDSVNSMNNKTKGEAYFTELIVNQSTFFTNWYNNKNDSEMVEIIALSNNDTFDNTNATNDGLYQQFVPTFGWDEWTRLILPYLLIFLLTVIGN